ncbi:phosphoribosylaminoimidazolesuccinocarboxamide synthase [Rodentibacter pneumotropicus]|uniref:Phosphoribosylaminoimidazole-succinocarboxamide synthase n=1 Tax=Rodentibacter pneumotropicus TaxID=758 RepID=A0A3S4URI1_9PAST|nr:phosphoribosylaminoimidazolesuccinocarboxamide synthase [Rodentibacter pneumotropicus]
MLKKCGTIRADFYRNKKGANHDTTNSQSEKIYSGKVRDLYEIDDKRMLMVATDRLSAFDVILDDPIPRKGEILTQISNFWFNQLAHIMPNHFTGDSVYDVLPKEEADLVKDRAVVCKRLSPIKIESIVRGYLTGSGLKDYQQTGTICGLKLPKGLVEASKLPEPILPLQAKRKWETTTLISAMKNVKN